MKAITFLRQTVVNPETGEESERLAVRFDNAKVIKLYFGKDTLEDTITKIKANKQAALDRVVVREGEYGEFCVLSNAVTSEEI